MSKTSISGCSTFFAAGDAIAPQLKANVSKVRKSLFAAKTTTLLGMIGLNLFTELTLLCLCHLWAFQRYSNCYASGETV